MRYIRYMTIIFLLISVTVSSWLACQGEKHYGVPRLVVVIVVDQMRADHLTRFAGVYRYGFARLGAQQRHADLRQPGCRLPVCEVK